jgi:hypothetical protein
MQSFISQGTKSYDATSVYPSDITVVRMHRCKEDICEIVNKLEVSVLYLLPFEVLLVAIGSTARFFFTVGCEGFKGLWSHGGYNQQSIYRRPVWLHFPFSSHVLLYSYVGNQIHTHSHKR